ncbi:MAG: hypothetical protein KAJ01_07885, partial [Candidatus Hydrogenedentes bacterium]|nr:hypothetical protein [Candidatus Hydrogenedentota bacterium]
MSKCLLRVTGAVLCAGIMSVCSACFSQETEAGDAEQVPKELADQYGISLEERQSEVSVLSENVVRIDNAMRALRNELAREDRRGRAKDLRARIEQLTERKKAFNERIETERRALPQAGELEPGEAFNRVAAKELVEEQTRRHGEIQALDEQIAALQTRLERRGGTRIRRENLTKQIEELTRGRAELASRRDVDVEDTAAV